MYRQKEKLRVKRNQPISRWFLLPTVELAAGDNSSSLAVWCSLRWPSLRRLIPKYSYLGSGAASSWWDAESTPGSMFSFNVKPFPPLLMKKESLRFLHPLPHPMLSLWDANHGHSNRITLILDNRCMHWFEPNTYAELRAFRRDYTALSFQKQLSGGAGEVQGQSEGVHDYSPMSQITQQIQSDGFSEPSEVVLIPHTSPLIAWRFNHENMSSLS